MSTVLIQTLEVSATATLEGGRPFHATEGDTGMRTHFQVTPYHFTLVIEGPGATTRDGVDAAAKLQIYVDP